jgi:L-lactate dehydrogenase complex protein LldG
VLSAKPWIANCWLPKDTPHGEVALDELPPAASSARLRHGHRSLETEMFNATPASLTAARSAIAETGTLILWPDAWNRA